MQVQYEISAPLAFAVNGILLALSIVSALFMLNGGVQWSFHKGNSKEQAKDVQVILRSIVFMIFIGLAAAIMNLLFV